MDETYELPDRGTTQTDSVGSEEHAETLTRARADDQTATAELLQWLVRQQQREAEREERRREDEERNTTANVRKPARKKTDIGKKSIRKNRDVETRFVRRNADVETSTWRRCSMPWSLKGSDLRYRLLVLPTSKTSRSTCIILSSTWKLLKFRRTAGQHT